ncbi:uncharacterized protein LOC120763201 isoform X2 [Hirundo rustica]|uniref:uncharacterized protein LOC120763201 isoform X2 n=1 Tax=Hirundo rustica TaxID=43150 RepID=UPI001A94C597|nr:uncharacterized protein LOC120763201 isoform X2 [Hirundo rustica]
MFPGKNGAGTLWQQGRRFFLSPLRTGCVEQGESSISRSLFVRGKDEEPGEAPGRAPQEPSPAPAPNPTEGGGGSGSRQIHAQIPSWRRREARDELSPLRCPGANPPQDSPRFSRSLSRFSRRWHRRARDGVDVNGAFSGMMDGTGRSSRCRAAGREALPAPHRERLRGTGPGALGNGRSAAAASRFSAQR